VDSRTLEDAIRRHIRFSLCQRIEECDGHELFVAVGLAVRDLLIDRGLGTFERFAAVDPKRIYYLSMEFLMGRSLENNLQNLGLLDACQQAVAAIGADLDQVLEAEPDAALGNGGLGRLAACFLDSMATMDLPAFGYGINYDFGLFRQEIIGESSASGPISGGRSERPGRWRGTISRASFPSTAASRPRPVSMAPTGPTGSTSGSSSGFHTTFRSWATAAGR
jgi:starch phosphorylase